MEFSGLSLESSLSSDSVSEDTFVEGLNIEEIEESEGAAEEEVIQYITYNTVSEATDYDTIEMVNICCMGILIGCGAAFFAFLVRLSIYSVLSTFREFTGAGKEE